MNGVRIVDVSFESMSKVIHGIYQDSISKSVSTEIERITWDQTGFKIASLVSRPVIRDGIFFKLYGGYPYGTR